MKAVLLGAGGLFLVVANVLLFAASVPLRPSAVVAYMVQMLAAVLLVPALVVIVMLAVRRFRKPRLLFYGVLAGLSGSLALSAASIAWSPGGAPAPDLVAWEAGAAQARLDERCRRMCSRRGPGPDACAALCSCTTEALFSSRSDAELRHLTAEGPYGRLPRETNQLLGDFARECAEAQKPALAAGEHEQPAS